MTTETAKYISETHFVGVIADNNTLPSSVRAELIKLYGEPVVVFMDRAIWSIPHHDIVKAREVAQ